jgi:hypothetical protein
LFCFFDFGDINRSPFLFCTAPTHTFYNTHAHTTRSIFSAQVKTKHPQAKWVLAGVALVMDVGE